MGILFTIVIITSQFDPIGLTKLIFFVSSFLVLALIFGSVVVCTLNLGV